MTFVFFCLNGAICCEINLPLQSEKTTLAETVLWNLLLMERQNLHWLHGGGQCPRDGESHLFGGKWMGGGRSSTAPVEYKC